MSDDLRHYEAMALMVGRSMARKLRGLEGAALRQVTRRFLEAFLTELDRSNRIDSGTLLALAHLPLDLALLKHQEEADEPGPVLQEAPRPQVALATGP